MTRHEARCRRQANQSGIITANVSTGVLPRVWQRAAIGTWMPVVILALISICDRISTVALLGTRDRRGHLGRLRESYVVTEWIT
jgi:hypothetical protein